MLKKLIIPIVLCAVLLCSCSAKVADGGAPTPIPNTASEWGEDVSTPSLQIKRSEAEKVLIELYTVVSEISNGTMYLSDITYMDSVCSYLSQYNTFNTELAVYMESVRALLDSYCSFYARNISADNVREQITAYVDGYYALSDEFHNQYGVIEIAVLNDMLNKVELMANVSNNQ